MVELPDGRHTAAQITAPSLLSDAKGKQITFVLPTLPAGGSVRIRPATLNYIKAPPHFRFVENKGEWTGTDIIFEIAAREGRTEVRFTHRGLDPRCECYGACSDGWGNLLTRNLRGLIATGEPQPDAFA